MTEEPKDITITVSELSAIIWRLSGNLLAGFMLQAGVLIMLGICPLTYVNILSLVIQCSRQFSRSS